MRALAFSLLSVLSLVTIPVAQARTVTTPRMSARSVRLQTIAKRLAASKKYVPAIPLTNAYENKDLGVSMRYPTDWTVNDAVTKEGNLTFVVGFYGKKSKQSVRPNANLVTEVLTDPSMTVDQYTAEGLKNVQSVFDDFKLLRSEPDVVAGKTAHRVVYWATSNGVAMKLTQVWFFNRGMMHVWTYADQADTFDASEPTFEAMLGTLVVK